MGNFKELIRESSSNHRQLCPRQILGIRIGLAGGKFLGMNFPRNDKALLIISETDGCFVSGVMAATGCSVWHRTLRIEDLGKVAATFIKVDTGRAIRVAPRSDVRQRAFDFAPGEANEYQAQLLGYQIMPDDQLLRFEQISLKIPLSQTISRPRTRVQCVNCGEEIINERGIAQGRHIICRTCAGYGYYKKCIEN